MLLSETQVNREIESFAFFVECVLNGDLFGKIDQTVFEGTKRRLWLIVETWLASNNVTEKQQKRLTSLLNLLD